MSRTLRHGDAIPSGQPKRSLMVTGYIQLRWRSNGEDVVCYEHRFVMGVPPGGAIVHHINGIKTDNRVENLEVVASQSVHALSHRQPTFDVVEAMHLYHGGMGVRRLGKRFGVHPTNISRTLKKRGLVIRARLVSRSAAVE